MSNLAARRYALELEERALSRLLSNLAVEKLSLHIAELRNQNASKPINILPDAILGDIFQYVHDDAFPPVLSVPSTAYSCNRPLLPLMATCHRWLVVCLGRGSLWSRICAMPFTSVEKVELGVQRAQENLLDLTVFPNPAGELWPHLSRIFDPLLHRCRSLQVVGCLGDTSFLFPLPSLMPHLRVLDIKWEVMPGNRPQDTRMPSIFHPDAVGTASLKRLTLQLLNPGNIPTPSPHPLGLGRLDLGALHSIDITFDFLPTNLCDILSRVPNLLSLKLTRHGSRRDIVPRLTNAGPEPRFIQFPHLKEASLRGLPHSVLGRISALHLERFTVESAGDLDFMTPLCSAQLGSPPPNADMPRPKLKTFRMLSNPHGPSEIFWKKLLLEQPLLEEIECQNSPYFHTALVASYPAACRRIRHIKLKWTFYPLATGLLTQGRDMGEAFISMVSSGIATILHRIHQPLDDGEAGLRFTLELADPGDIEHLDELFASHPRVRILPRDQPWAHHPEWPPSLD